MAISTLSSTLTLIHTTQTDTILKAELNGSIIVTDDNPEGITLKQGERVILGPNVEIRAKSSTENAAIISYIPISKASRNGPSQITPVTGTFLSTGNSGSFTPIAGRSFNITITGNFVGVINLQRSFDNGAIWVPITANSTPILSFENPVSEQWSDDEQGVMYRLSCVTLSTGSALYRISQ